VARQDADPPHGKVWAGIPCTYPRTLSLSSHTHTHARTHTHVVVHAQRPDILRTLQDVHNVSAVHVSSAPQQLPAGGPLPRFSSSSPSRGAGCCSYADVCRVQVFNNSPDETVFFRLCLNREDVNNTLVMISNFVFSSLLFSPPSFASQNSLYALSGIHNPTSAVAAGLLLQWPAAACASRCHRHCARSHLASRHLLSGLFHTRALTRSLILLYR
jgi:hypothetical protein